MAKMTKEEIQKIVENKEMIVDYIETLIVSVKELSEDYQRSGMNKEIADKKATEDVMRLHKTALAMM